MAGTPTSFMASGVPAYISSSLANIYTPPASTITSVITHIHVCNTSLSSCWFSLYVGATGTGAGGTELFKFFVVGATGSSTSTYDWYPQRKMISTNFLVGIAQTASTLTIDVSGYQYVTG